MPDFKPATDLTARVVAGVRDDQLTDRTPCTAYSVADLVNHMSMFSRGLAMSARKEPTEGGPGQVPDADVTAQEGWREQLVADLDALATAWSDPAAYDGMTSAGSAQMPAGVVGMLTLDEVVVHGWDLARATGQEYDGDPAALSASLSFVDGFLGQPQDVPPEQAPFAPPVPVPDDAATLDRLVGRTGRDPSWTA